MSLPKNHPVRIGILITIGFFLLIFQFDFIMRGVWSNAFQMGKPPILGIIMLIGGIWFVVKSSVEIYKHENKKTRALLTYLFPVYIGVAAWFYYGFYKF